MHFTKVLLLLFFSGTLSIAYGQNKQTVTGFEAVAKTERLPFLFPPGTKKNRFVSYDASGGNGFGLFQSTFKKYVDEKGELVIFDAYGPGCLFRQQMNIWVDSGIGVKSKTIRIKYYFDDDQKPALDAPAYDLFNGQYPPVNAPFGFRGENQFGLVYYPFPFQKRLKITLSDTLITRLLKNNIERTCNWYQFDYLTYTPGATLNTWQPGANAYEEMARQQWTHLGRDPKPATGNRYHEKRTRLRAGDSLVIFDHQGQASIAGITIKIDPFTAETFYNTYIRMVWDNRQQAAVDMPISYFFGGGGVKDDRWNVALNTLLYGFDAKQHTAYCYWPMPFWEHATIQLINRSRQNLDSLYFKIAWKPADAYSYPRDSAGYFMARITSDSSAGGKSRKNFTRPYMTAFHEEGYGHVAAINMWSGNFYEDGDEFTYTDHSQTPQVHGAGTEDEFNQGWAGGRYQKPLWGSLDNGVKGAYRIHMNEPYIFYNHIDIRFELTNSVYPGNNPRRRNGTPDTMIETDFMVWFYKSPAGNRLTLTDSLDVGDPLSEKAHAYTVAGARELQRLTQSYDSYESADDFDITTDHGRSFNRYAEFTVTLDPANTGVRLRKRTNRTGNGIQTAIVYVDGKQLPAPWHIVTYSGQAARGKRSFDGWFDSEYEIPAAYTKGKKQVRIRVQHQRSIKNELNDFYYRVYCYSMNDKVETRQNNSRLNDAVFCFYYNWYGNPAHDGKYIHWAHPVMRSGPSDTTTRSLPGGNDIAANFYPALGAYSSLDRDIVKQHMQMISEAGIGVIVVTWWNKHDFMDKSIPLILNEAAAAGIKVAFHIEPFGGRNAATTRQAIEYIIDTYGNHAAFFRSKKNRNRPFFFIYDSYLTTAGDWAGLLQPGGPVSIRNTKYDAVMIGLWVKQNEAVFFKQAGFDGMYTYFASSGFTYGATPANWKTMQQWAVDNKKIFIPCVGPGYIDTRVRPWNDRNTKDREGGTYYSEMFEKAIESKASYIGITSFNEWHEGTQIEPAIPFTPKEFNYLDYEPHAPDHYLKLTKRWILEFVKRIRKPEI